MANELAAAYVQIIPSLRGAQATIARELGGGNYKGVGLSVGGSVVSGIKAAATAGMAAVAAATGIAIGKGFGRLKAIDQAQAKLRGLGSSAAEVKLVMQNATAAVTGTAYGLDSAATAAAGAMAAGIKPGKELERNLKLVADAATIAGVDMGSMGAIFNKVAASNKVQMDVINQLHDAGVPALTMLSNTMGVTVEEAAKMASSGKVDFATFQKAMEEGLGGAALSSGDTFTGALANVNAALGRAGANFMGGFFPKLAPMFQAIQAALKPVEEKAAQFGGIVGNKLNPIIDKFTELLKNGKFELGEMKQVIAPLIASFLALGAGGFAPLLSAIPGLGGLAGVFVRLSSPVGLAVAALGGLIAVSPELQDSLSQVIAAAADAVSSLTPHLKQIGEVISSVAQAAIPVLVSAIHSALNVLKFLLDAVNEHPRAFLALAAGVAAVVVGLKAYKVITAAAKAITAGYTAATYGAAGASYVKGRAEKAAFITTRLLNGELLKTIARTKLQGRAEKAAAVKQAVFTGAAKAAAVAQRLFNLAMKANPLITVITLVGTLVSGLVWFFTQTEEGKKKWQEFTRFLGEAWENIVNVAKTVWAGIVTAVTVAWNAIVEGVQNALQWIVNAFLNWTLPGLIISNWDSIVAAFQNAWNFIVDGFNGFLQWIVDLFLNWTLLGQIIKNWDTIVAVFKIAWENIKQAVANGVNAVVNFIQGFISNVKAGWNAAWSAIGNFFSAIWRGIVAAARGFGRSVSDTFQNVVNFVKSIPGKVLGFFSGIGNTLVNSGRALIDGFLQGIRNAFAGAKNFIADSLANIRNLFPFSPAKEGPFSGRGWVKYSGLSVGETFAESVQEALRKGRSGIRSELAGISAEFDAVSSREMMLQTAASVSGYRFGQVQERSYTNQAAPRIEQHNNIRMLDRDPRVVLRQLNRELQEAL